MNDPNTERPEKNNILRWAAAIAAALLIAYLRTTGILPENTQGNAVSENASIETVADGAAGENSVSGELQEAGSSLLTRDEFCRTTYEVFVYSFCDSDGDGIGDLKGLLSKLDYINDGDPTGGEDLGMTGMWLMPVFPSPDRKSVV